MEGDSNANNETMKEQDQQFVIGGPDSEEGYNSDVDDFDNDVIEPAQVEILDEKHCWVCFASEEDDPSASWTSPCRCKTPLFNTIGPKIFGPSFFRVWEFGFEFASVLRNIYRVCSGF